MSKPPAVLGSHTETSSRSHLPSRRERRRTEIRERLFRAALSLFAEKGFTETTVEDITNAADLGKGTFFNYFPSKEHIFIAFSEMQVGKLQQQVDEARRSSAKMPHILHRLSVRMTAEPGRNPEVVRLILMANLASEPVRFAMRENHARARKLLTQLIEIGQQRGEIRANRPAGEIADAFRQLVFGTLLLWSLHGEGPLKERIDSALEQLWNGLEAPRRKARERRP